MMLKYRILWFEDNEDYLESLKPRIVRFIDDLGFDPEIIPKTDNTDVDALLNSIEDFNLILMDYNLNSGPKADGQGSKILKKIRENDLYTEVVFYSNAKNILKARKEGFDGVYFTEKDQLFDKIKSVIILTLKKNQDINNIRGLVISEAIDLEEKMENILLKFFNFDRYEMEVFKTIFNPDFTSFTFNNKFSLINIALNKRKEKLSNSLQQPSDTGKKLTSGEKKAITDQIKLLNEFKEIFILIESEVIGTRNTLAHVKPHEKNKLKSRSKDKKGKDIIIDDEWCKLTRSTLKKHSKNIDDLLKKLS
jgi:hypothetical protein